MGGRRETRNSERNASGSATASAGSVAGTYSALDEKQVRRRAKEKGRNVTRAQAHLDENAPILDVTKPDDPFDLPLAT